MPVLSIIETGLAPEKIRADWPNYPSMFEALLAPHLPDWSYDTIALATGAPLPDPSTLDAVLITGSAAGVYDDMPWMAALMDFIRWTAEAQKPQVGICFGHQAIAHALGAQVAKSDKGWGIGRHAYEIEHAPSWMGASAPEGFSLGVSHQDQVLTLPPGAVRVAQNDFCEFAALAYPGANAISFQGHPEFSPGFSIALYNVRRGTKLSHEMVDRAEQSLETAIDNDLVGRWMAAFLIQSSR